MTDETIQAYIKANSVDMIARAKRVILSNKPLENFNAEEVEKTTELFFEVNAAWFEQGKSEPVSNVKKLPLLIHKALENMAESIAILIQNGHTNVHNYGWSFYQSVITVTNRQAESNGK